MLLTGFNAAFVMAQGVYDKPVYLSSCIRVNSLGIMALDTLQSQYILKGTRIWRNISLESPENRLIFNSHKPCKEVCFFEILKYGLLELNLKAFTDEDFSRQPKTLLEGDKLQSTLYHTDTLTETIFDANGESSMQKRVVSGFFGCADIRSLLLKEDWVINNYSGRMDKYLIAIAPMVYSEKDKKLVPLFWIYYPEWAGLFSLFKAHNIYSYEEVNYATVFEKRKFVSAVSKESNVFNRSISDYKRGYDAEMESERIIEKLRNSESDLFEH